MSYLWGMAKEKFNPFPVNRYESPELFCDRKAESHRLRQALENGTDTVVHAPRRFGKTGLIHHVFQQLDGKGGALCIFLEVFSAQNLEDFNNLLLEAVTEKLAERDANFFNKVGQLFKGLRPILSFDPLTGVPQVSVGTGDVQTQRKSLSEIFKILRQQEHPIYIAIDEFQQILSFEDQSPEALLRSEIQQSPNLSFIFSGSQRQLLLPMFSDAARPFFSSTGFLQLEKLNRETYRDFIVEKFAGHGKKITPEQAGHVLAWCDDHTYYVQAVCNRLFANTGKTVTDLSLRETLSGMVREQDAILTSLRLMLKSSPNQWELFRAISLEGAVSQPTARDFMQKYKLASSAAVVGALKALEEKELIYVSEMTDEGKAIYRNYNPFFANWFRFR